jgi:hypothetical protein
MLYAIDAIVSEPLASTCDSGLWRKQQPVAARPCQGQGGMF